MDNITHSLTGLMMSRAGLDKYCPRAAWLLMLAANIPDIDILHIFAGNSVNYLDKHRGITHGLAMAPVMALLPMIAIGMMKRAGFPWLKAFLLSLLGVLSHLALDFTNIYGIRLGLPFRGDWYRLDLTSVIDLWIWCVLGLCFLWPLLSRLVTSEIGARSNPARGIARFALLFLVLYNGGRALLHGRAMETMESRLHDGQNPIRLAALPYMGNPFRWTGIVQIRNGFVVHEIDLLRDFDPTRGEVHYDADPSPAIDLAKTTRAFQVFLDFSDFTIWRVTSVAEPEGTLQVDATDMRFSPNPSERRFTATAIIDAAGKVKESVFHYEQPGQPMRLR
jgi:inner membrane protein